MDKTKILLYGDYCCSTGFGTVMSNIARELQSTGRYDIDVVGINYSGDPYDVNKWPGRVWPAMSGLRMQGNYADVYGRQFLVDKLGQGNYDVVFMLQDTFIVQSFIPMLKELQEKHPKPFKVVYYFPIDAAPKHDWIEQVVSQVDFPVVYTEYGKRECAKFVPALQDTLRVIYHGTNLDDFKPITDGTVQAFRERYFGPLSEKFIITNVNRNQARKDIMRNFMVLNELRKSGMDDAILYMHMQQDDVGGNILVMADHFNFKKDEDYLFADPRYFSAHQGVSVEIVNYIYNASDVLLTTTLGEGWGLSITEAMAAKLPVVGPNNTSLTEMIGEDRGWLVNSGHTPSLWNMKEGDNERLRPLMDVESAAQAIKQIRENPTERQKRIDNAYAWVSQLTWKSLCEQWVKIVDQAATEAKTAQAFKNSPFMNRQQRRAVEKAK